jgi:transcriptional repressor NrdR
MAGKNKVFLFLSLFYFPMKCPYCGSLETRVVDKRETENQDVTRRRRECLDCKKRVTTYERVEIIPLFVIKKNGAKELFDRNKIEKGMLKACEKRPVSPETIKNSATDIELLLRAKESTEIGSSAIGKLVMNRLKKLDKVAYIRFASVYKDFKDPEEFEDELKRLKR